VGDSVRKMRAVFGVNPHKKCLHCYFFRNMADEQVGTKSVLHSIINSISIIYNNITVNPANETQITRINYRLWLACILLQGNRAVYKNSHHKWILFSSIILHHVLCFCQHIYKQSSLLLSLL